MNATTPDHPAFRAEGLRLNGEQVTRERKLDVFGPCTNPRVGTVNVWEVPGYRIELTPFGGIKDSGLGYKEGVQEAMKSFTNLKTFSLPWG